MLRNLSMLVLHVRMFAWRWLRRAVAESLWEHQELCDGGIRVSFLPAWGPLKGEYIVWRWRPNIQRARIYGCGLLFGEAVALLKQVGSKPPNGWRLAKSRAGSARSRPALRQQREVHHLN